MEQLRGLERLTPSEKITLRLVAQCMSTREIADHLALSPRTVENRRCSIAQKLNLPGGRGLQQLALRIRDLL
jgi:DNA-binding NarL/FixJ family response regulator